MGQPSGKQYDDDVAPHLRRIRHCARMAAYYASAAIFAAESMRFMPQWETIAEDSLKVAIKKLKEAEEILSKKPREKV